MLIVQHDITTTQQLTRPGHLRKEMAWLSTSGPNTRIERPTFGKFLIKSTVNRTPHWISRSVWENSLALKWPKRRKNSPVDELDVRKHMIIQNFVRPYEDALCSASTQASNRFANLSRVLRTVSAWMVPRLLNDVFWKNSANASSSFWRCPLNSAP